MMSTPQAIADTVKLIPHFKKVVPYGSYFIEGVENPGDVDYLCYSPKFRHSITSPENTIHKKILSLGFTFNGDMLEYGKDFASYRKEDINLIVTDNERVFYAKKLAQEFCEKFKVVNKKERISIHEGFEGVTSSFDAYFDEDDLEAPF